MLDWNGISHDTDFTITVTGTSHLQVRSLMDETDHIWHVAVRPSEANRHVALACRDRDTLRVVANWQPLASIDTPDTDVYMNVTASEPLEPKYDTISFPVTVPLMPNNQCQQFIVDFGREVIGWVEVEVVAASGTVLDFVGFEAIQEGVLKFAQGMNNSFRYICRAGVPQTYTALIRCGLRYLLISVHNCLEPLTIQCVNLRQATYPQPMAGRFQCSNPRLNHIWEVCAYTERICSEDVFSSDSAYEQALWVGDAYNQLLVHQVVYGEPSLPDYTFRLIADSLRRTPIVNSQVPSAWENAPIPNWSWLWALGCQQYYRFTADKVFVADIYPAMAQQAKFALQQCASHPLGLFTLEDAWHFLDWSPLDGASMIDRTFSILAHENCLLVAALRATAVMGEVLEKYTDAQHWYQVADDLSEAINDTFWSDNEQTYVDSLLIDGSLSPKISQPVNTTALFAGVATRERAAALLPYLISPPPHWVGTGSPFMMYFNMEVLVWECRFPELLHLIRARWGDMLDHGATTTWETFMGSYPLPGVWTRSWCHAWSAIPAYFLSTYVLGVSPVEAGYKRIRIAPQVIDFRWVRGTVPTPFGNLEISWQVDEQHRFYIDYAVPNLCEVEVVCPEGYRLIN